MARGKETKIAESFTVEDLFKDHKTPSWQYAAAARANGWAKGKKMTKAEYEEALVSASLRPLAGK